MDNSDFIAKRVSDGGYGPEPDSLLSTELHRFIYEYDDADPYRSAWFLHRLELVLEEARREASNAKVSGGGAFPPSTDVLCLGEMTMKCEHCGQPAMRGFLICRRCWQIFGDDE